MPPISVLQSERADFGQHLPPNSGQMNARFSPVALLFNALAGQSGFIAEDANVGGSDY